jgi:hypothetical protein
VFSLILIAWLFSGGPQRRRLAYLWIATAAGLTITRAGERTGLALVAVAALILYHRQLKPLRARTFAALLAAGLFLFTALGVYRGLRGEDRQAFSLGVTVGEFESIFANAVDLWQHRWAGDMPDSGGLLLSEILAPIPSQLLPFRKRDYSSWYLDEFYPTYGEAGGGLAFGVVAQAAVGFGVAELVLRGIVTGLIFGWLRRWYGRRSQSLAVTTAYLWCVLFAYYAVRVGTLSNLSAFVQFVPLALLLVFGRRAWLSVMQQDGKLEHA